MFAKLRTLALALSLPLAACAQLGPTGVSAGAIQSCFRTASGLACVETPGGAATGGQDVDGDGVIDPFVCADDDQDGDGIPDFRDSDDNDGGIDDHGGLHDDGGIDDHGGLRHDGGIDDHGGLDDDGGRSGDSDDNGVDDSIQCDSTSA